MKKFLILLSLVLALLVMASCQPGQNPGGSDQPPQNGDPNCDHGEGASILPGRAKEPTCTEDGYTADQHCIECGFISVASEAIPALGHTPSVIPAKEATCLAAGNTAGVRCAKCEDVITPVQPIAQLDHQIVPSADVPATCTSAGSIGGEHCVKCLTTITEPETIIPAFGHDRGLDHIVVTEGNAATCNSTGLTDSIFCNICNTEILAAVEIPVTEHLDLAVVEGYAATCVATGLTDGEKCNYCGVTTVEQEDIDIDPEAHPEDSLITLDAVAPTCHSDGLTEGKYCNACAAVALAQEDNTDRPGHNLIEKIAALAPDCSTETDGHTVHMVCDNEGCDYEEPSVTIKFEHIPGEWTANINPGVGTEGEKYTHCTECDKLLVEKVPALPAEGENPDAPGYVDPDGIV